MLEFSDETKNKQVVQVKPWMKFFLNESIIINVIVLNSIVLFMLGIPSMKDSLILERIDHLFTIYFLIEAFAKIRAFSWKGYIKNNWNRFDFFLVIISIPSLFELSQLFPDISFLLVFRLLRLFRILRFLEFIPNIKEILTGIRRAFRASMFVLIVLVIYNVLLAIISNSLFAKYSPEYFGDPFVSLFSIFQVFTIEGWNDIVYSLVVSASDNSFMVGFIRLYFTIVVLSGGIFGFSIVNAIFVEEMVRDNNDNLEDKIDDLNRKVEQLLEKDNLDNE